VFRDFDHFEADDGDDDSSGDGGTSGGRMTWNRLAGYERMKAEVTSSLLLPLSVRSATPCDAILCCA
jgi:hypothetical protein